MSASNIECFNNKNYYYYRYYSDTTTAIDTEPVTSKRWRIEFFQLFRKMYMLIAEYCVWLWFQWVMLALCFSVWHWFDSVAWPLPTSPSKISKLPTTVNCAQDHLLNGESCSRSVITHSRSCLKRRKFRCIIEKVWSNVINLAFFSCSC